MHLTPAAIRVPFGVTVVKITPSILTLNLERTERKTIPVRPRVTGRPAAGFEVAEVTSDPPEVRIAGPSSRVQEIESAFTEPVSVEGASASTTEAVGVGLEDPLLRLEGGSRVRVSVSVTGAAPPERAPGPGKESAEEAEGEFRMSGRTLFGTDGIRGVANEHPMTPELALALGRAVTFVAGRGKRHAPRIADRQGHAPLRLHARDGARVGHLRRMGGRVMLCGPIPTPAVAHLTVEHARRRGHRDQRQPQPVRRQRHQDLRPRRLQAARRRRGRDRDA